MAGERHEATGGDAAVPAVGRAVLRISGRGRKAIWSLTGRRAMTSRGVRWVRACRSRRAQAMNADSISLREARPPAGQDVVPDGVDLPLDPAIGGGPTAARASILASSASEGRRVRGTVSGETMSCAGRGSRNACSGPRRRRGRSRRSCRRVTGPERTRRLAAQCCGVATPGCNEVGMRGSCPRPPCRSQRRDQQAVAAAPWTDRGDSSDTTSPLARVAVIRKRPGPSSGR